MDNSRKDPLHLFQGEVFFYLESDPENTLQNSTAVKSESEDQTIAPKNDQVPLEEEKSDEKALLEVKNKYEEADPPEPCEDKTDFKEGL